MIWRFEMMDVSNKVDNVNTSESNEVKDYKKIFTTFILVITLMICTTSATYAYFALSVSNSGMSGTVATASLSLTVTQAELKSVDNTRNMIPQREEYLSAAMNTTNKCVDGNNNIICKVYTVTITNTSTASAKVKGTIQFSGNEYMPNLKWSLADDITILGTHPSVAVGTDTTTTYDIETGNSCSVVEGVDVGCTTLTLAKGTGTKTYHIVVWINETGAAQTDRGTWVATLKFEGENGGGITSTITSAT